MAALYLLGSCAGPAGDDPERAALPDGSYAVPIEFASGLPPLPEDRRAAELSGQTVQGSAAVDMSFNAAVSDTDLELVSSSNGTSWGIWRLALGNNEPLSVEVLLDLPEGDEAWFALANYTTGRWQFDGPNVLGKVLQLQAADHLSEAGNCYVGVIVAGGNQATVDRLVLTFDRTGWQVVTVEDSGVCAYTSLAEVDGNPAIAYCRDFDGNSTVQYVRSTTSSGFAAADWSQKVTVDDAAFTSASLAVVDGHPALSYISADFKEVVYVRASTLTGAAGADWGGKVTVEDEMPLGHFGNKSELAASGSSPVVSYSITDNFFETLMYTTGSFSIKQEVADGDLNEDWSMQRNSGDTPYISFCDFKELGFGRRIGGLWETNTLHTTEHRLTFSSTTELALGRPAVCFHEAVSQDLYYMVSDTLAAEPADWGEPIPVHAMGDVGEHCSLATIQGRPAICYWDRTNGSLRYIKSTGNFGEQAADWLQVPQVVDPKSKGYGEDGEVEDQPGFHTSLAEIDGRPAVSYTTRFLGVLKYAVLWE